MNILTSILTITVLSTSTWSNPNTRSAAQLPVYCGEVVVTHFSGDDGFGQVDPNGFVLTLIDTRIPPLFPTPWPFAGTLWSPTMFNNMGTGIYEWNAHNLGTIFGLSMPIGNAPDIYVAASPCVYGNYDLSLPGVVGPAGAGGIYRINGTSGQINTFIPTGFGGANEMPNLGPGLGNIHVDGNMVYATNLDDGKIYVIDSLGIIIQIYDPFAPSPVADGVFESLGERPYAIAIDPSGTTLYFSIWLRDGGRPSTPWPTAAGPAPPNPNNSIWSLGVDANGFLFGTPQLEIVLPYLPNTQFSNPVTDISFSPTGTMLVAERTYFSDCGQIDTGHQARILEYDPGWTPSSRVWQLGAPIVGGIAPNAVGGVASDDDSHTWASCDQITFAGKYGLTRLPFPGNTVPTRITSSIPIEIPGVLKNAMGELDCRNCGQPEPVGACCTENQFGDFLCVLVTAEECDLVYQGVFYGIGSDCLNIVCDGTPVIGACCYLDFAGVWQCLEITQDECLNQLLGVWFNGQSCSAIDCTTLDPVGACCYPSFTGGWLCTNTGEAECINQLNGNWYAGQQCSAIDCDLLGNLGACCYLNPVTLLWDCVLTNQIDCDNVYQGTWYNGQPCSTIDCVIGVPVGACCYNDPAIGLTCFEFTSQANCEDNFGGTWYFGQPCSSINCNGGVPVGACCYLDATGVWDCFFFTSQSNCEDNFGGTWYFGLTCADILCPPLAPIGACCYLDSLTGFLTCVEVTEDDCASLPASTYNGDSSICANVICCPPIGACCLSDGQCLLTSSDQCASINGIYGGDGVLCVNVVCPNCPGDINGDGVVDITDLLILIGAWGLCP